jgi:hypothetical protein
LTTSIKMYYFGLVQAGQLPALTPYGYLPSLHQTHVSRFARQRVTLIPTSLLSTYGRELSTEIKTGTRSVKETIGGLLLSPPSGAAAVVVPSGHSMTSGSHTGAGGLLLSPAVAGAGASRAASNNTTGRILFVFMVSPFKAKVRQAAMIGETAGLFKFS